MRTHGGRIHQGERGVAEQIVVDEYDHPDSTGTVAAWILDCPGQAAFWRHYMLAVVHLRPIPGQSRPPSKQWPGATHEFLLYALDPDKNPTVDNPASWQYLIPMNLVEQVELPNDQNAAELCELCVKAVLAGQLWAEPPLSGQTEPWRTTLIQTSAHYRHEPHAGCPVVEP